MDKSTIRFSFIVGKSNSVRSNEKDDERRSMKDLVI